MKYWVVIILASVICGCADLRLQPASATAEVVFQGLNAVDFAQTVNIARRPDCYRESEFPTAQILGEHPSVSGVEGYWAATSVAHFAISNWLDREVEATDSDGWRVARVVWHAATIGISIRAVVNNYHIGLRPFGAGAAPRCEKIAP